MKSIWTIIGLIATLLSCSTVALADATSDLTAVMAAFNALHSYHVDMTLGNGQQVQFDFVAPSSYHEIMPGGLEMVITPGSTRMKMNGKWQTIPQKFTGNLSKSMDSARTWSSDNNNKSKYTITDLGMDGGFHKYQMEEQGTSSFIWVRHDNLPDHMEVHNQSTTTLIQYSKFNEPIPFPT